MLNKFTISLFFPCIIFISEAQNYSNDIRNIIPPSPNTASLGKYGEIPVSLYTGIPDITIPIYNINDGNLSLPISLSYHASGVKVEEIPSSVGLGWTLNSGGIVGRTVRGLPDELGQWQPQSSTNTIENIMLSGDNSRINQLKNDVEDRYRDGEPDIYYYNFNQRSGKFFYDQSGGTHSYPYKNIVIAKIAPDGWQITIEDGTVYSFMEAEEIASSGCGEGEDQNIKTGWYLTSIKSSDGKREITFTYESVWILSTTLLGQTKYFLVDATGTSSCLPNPAPCLGTNQSRTYRLSRIDFSEGSIQFNYNNIRCDLVDDKSLDLIQIYTKDNKLVKKFSFAYSYFGNNTDGVNRLTENTKRLKLDSLIEQSTTSAKPPYIFTYEESIQLPSRLSYAQDHWGYYNGKFNNFDLIATFTTATPSGLALYPGADRRANSSTTQAGILKKIKYPTGGQTLFTYENNTVSDNRPEADFTEESILLNASNNTPVNTYPNPFESSTLVIPDGGAFVRFNISGIDSWPWAGCDIVGLQVIKDNNATPYRTLSNSLDGGTENWPAGTYKLRLVTECGDGVTRGFSASVIAQIITTESLAIRTVGGLRIKQIEDNPGNGSESVVKTYRYHPENDATHSSGVLVNFPDYGYDQTLDDYLKLPGDLPGVVHYVGTCQCRVRQSFSNYPMATTQGSYIGYGHVIEDLGDKGESRHSFVAYENFVGTGFPFAPVESYDWRRGFELGIKYYAKKDNQLSLVKDETNMPFASNEFRVYGVKTGRNYWNVVNNSTALIGELYWQKTDPVFQFYPTITEFYNIGQTKQRLYDQNDPTKFIETVIDYTYSPSHLQLTQTRYQSSISNQTTKEEILTNRKYPFDYSFSGTLLGSEALGIKKLQDLHVVNAIIEQNSVKQSRNVNNNQVSNQRVVASTITAYKNDNPYPDKIYKLETSSPISLSNFGNGSGISANAFLKNSNTNIATSYKPAVVFNSYDLKGNVSSQQKWNDVLHSYIWDYNSVNPIAEVTNSDVSSIAYTSFEADGTGNWILDAGSITSSTMSSPPPTGNKYYNLSPTTTLSRPVTTGKEYTVSYWSNDLNNPYTINGGSGTYKTGRTFNNRWKYYEHTITASSATLAITGTGAIDEVRLYPSNAQMTTYCYEPLIGMTARSDVNNRITYYEYDGFQRLKLIRDQERNIVKAFCYNYAGQTDCAMQSSTTDITVNTLPRTITGFSATFTNLNTGVQTIFPILRQGDILGNLPAGRYNVSISKPGNTLAYLFNFANKLFIDGTSATFYYVPVDIINGKSIGISVE